MHATPRLDFIFAGNEYGDGEVKIKVRGDHAKPYSPNALIVASEIDAVVSFLFPRTKPYIYEDHAYPEDHEEFIEKFVYEPERFIRLLGSNNIAIDLLEGFFLDKGIIQCSSIKSSMGEAEIYYIDLASIQIAEAHVTFQIYEDLELTDLVDCIHIEDIEDKFKFLQVLQG